MTPPPAPPRTPGADGVRAFACLLVLFHHLSMESLTHLPNAARLALQNGLIGVAVFFVLSGMLLSLPFWRAYLGAGPMPDIRAYARKRLARIVPGYYACLLTLAVVQWAERGNITGADLTRLVSSLTFTNSFHWRTYFPTELSPPTWSIGVEAVFYALLPVWAVGLFRTRGRVLPVVYTLAWMGGIAFGQWVLVSRWPECAIAADEPADRLQRIAAWWLPRHNPIGLFTHFLFGVLAGYAIVRGGARAGAGRVNWYDGLALLLLAVTAADFALAVVEQHEVLPPAARVLEYRTVAFIPDRWPVFPALVAAVLVALSRSRLLGALADCRFAAVTATLSFGIYLWHMPVIAFTRRAWPGLTGGDPGREWAFAIVVVALSYLAAAASYRLIERPFLRSAHRRA
ncbi:acyltransferase family protein [Urbifossiella limnaea]|uniref:O-acetyltransferase OatA n=1 Tax=Urbifossiella limnaea TaxID=2528023 RepID=A0A517XQ82_9BACT|nr:acyltransferase [Urbifossiella limnaea]QDU19660.1 O-acetyltransferase OatA [Urbifossiella limnaea]